MASPGDAPPPTPRGDLYIAAGFLVFAGAVLAASLAMPTFTEQGTPAYLAPGMVPGFHGVVMGLLALALAARSLARGALGAAGAGSGAGAPAAPRGSIGHIALATALTLVFALGLIGRMPFWLAAALFVFAFVLAFEWRGGIAPRELGRMAAWALAVALLSGWSATLLFENVFLIRMP